MRLRASWASALVVLAAAVSTTHAQLYWDINSGTAGAGGAAPAGTWDTLTANWNLDPQGDGDAGGGTTWTAGNHAIFSAGTDASTAFLVTLSGTQTASSILFQDGSVTLAGGQLDLIDAGSPADYNADGTVDAADYVAWRKLGLGGGAPGYTTWVADFGESGGGVGGTITTASGELHTINSVVGGSVGLTKEGADRLLLGGANVYTGGTTINAGTLQFGTTNSMPTTGTVTANSATTLSVNAGAGGEWTMGASGGGTIGGLIAGTGGQGLANQVEWTAGSNLGIDTTNAAGTLTYSNAIGNFHTSSGTTNSVGLTKRGAGTLELSAANSYTGSTTMAVSSGTLKLLATNTLPAATVLSLPPANGDARVELYDSGLTYYNQTIAGLSGGGIGTTTPTVVDVGFAQLTLDVPTGQSHTYTGYLKTDFTDLTTRGKVIKDGPGEFILAGQNGTSPHRFSGEFVMKAGRLGFANNVVLGVNNDISSPATLRIEGGTLFKANAPATSLSMTPRTVDIAGSFTFDLTGTTANAQILPAAPGSGVGGFNLLVDNPTITVNIPSLTNPVPTFILAGVISDGANSYGLTKDGNGTLTLNNPGNDWQGPTTILGGVIRLGPINATSGDGRVGDGTGVINLSGGAIEYNGAPSNGDGLRTLTVTNPINVTANSAITYRTAGGASGNSPGVEFVFSSNSIGGTGGTLTLLNDGSSNEPNATTPTLNPVLFKPTFTGSGFDFDRPIDIQNHASIANRTTALVSANTSGTHEFSGVISGNGGYLRNGAGGTSILSGNNTYTGDTSVLAGTLTIEQAYLADGADVLMPAASTAGVLFNLNFPGIGTIDTIDQLFFNGVAQATGTWGAPGSGAQHTDSMFGGDGWLLVSSAGGASPGVVPEPASMVLVMMAMLALSGARRRRGSSP